MTSKAFQVVLDRGHQQVQRPAAPSHPKGSPMPPNTPVFLPGESHGQRSLVGCSPVQFSRSVMSSSMQPP